MERWSMKWFHYAAELLALYNLGLAFADCMLERSMRRNDITGEMFLKWVVPCIINLLQYKASSPELGIRLGIYFL